MITIHVTEQTWYGDHLHTPLRPTWSEDLSPAVMSRLWRVHATAKYNSLPRVVRRFLDRDSQNKTSQNLRIAS